MIKSISLNNPKCLPSGYENSIKSFRNRRGRTITFGDGINLITGPNGVGKSTLLKDIAKYTLCYNTGFFLLENRALNDISNRYKYEKGQPYLSYGMYVLHDWQVCYSGQHLFNNDRYACELYGMAAIMAEFTKNSTSSGQNNLTVLDTILYSANKIDFIKRVDKDIERFEKQDFLNKTYHEEVMSYLKNRPLPPSKPTIILDEVDSNMDVLHVMEYFKTIEKMSNKYQFIITSHNPLAYMIENVKLIELKRGYNKQVTNEINKIYETIKVNRKES